MGWYDVFAHFYDPAIERVYRRSRSLAFAELGDVEGASIVDLACGTGQNFPLLVRLCGERGRIVGLDASTGMLGKAARRIARAGWKNVDLHLVDARALDRSSLSGPEAGFDVVTCTLGLSAIPEWEEVFAKAFARLRPGGRFLVMDVWSERRVPQSLYVELIARADLRRQVWRPLEDASEDFSMRFLPGSPHIHGGRLFVACGRRPVT